MLSGVTLEVQLGTLRNETLTTLLAATADDVATGFGCHAGAESVLLLAAALGWLEGAFHDGFGKKVFLALAAAPIWFRLGRARTLGVRCRLSMRQT